MSRTTHALLGLLLLTLPLAAQSPSTPAPAAPAPKFSVADVHVSPHSNQPFMRGSVANNRFIMRQSTMVDLIARAYGIANDNVLGGPSWLDTDRFDVDAHTDSTVPDENGLMLRALLADRFHLVVHMDTKALPAFVLTVGKGGPKLKDSPGDGPPLCGAPADAPKTPPGAVAQIYISCHNMTAKDIAENLHQMAGGYLTNPVVDQTGLKGTYEFDIKWTGRGNLTKAGADGISIFDAVDKQLGLKLEAKPAPLPVVVVDSVDEKPTPNAPGLDKALPPQPPAEFDVAIIKPSPPDKTRLQGQITGNQVNVTGATLQFLVTWAWNLNPGNKDALINAPKWLDQNHYDILAKVATDPAASASKAPPQIDFDELQQMIRTLLADRFKLQTHMEDRVTDAYTLIAVSPKIKKADPMTRTGCKEGPGPDGKDPRIANPILGRLLYCQNMSMAQLCDQLRILANGYMYFPVVDKTGLQGGYDFTLSFSSIGQLTSVPAPAASSDPSAATPSATDPNGGLSLIDAVSKQLGLKLEKERRPEPALVIDHINETPTEN